MGKPLLGGINNPIPEEKWPETTKRFFPLDKDPKEYADAVKFDRLTIQDVIDQNLQVVDMTASILAKENKMPMIVFGLNEDNSIIDAAHGIIHGTEVTVDD